jgi:CHAT domain-containing protein
VPEDLERQLADLDQALRITADRNVDKAALLATRAQLLHEHAERTDLAEDRRRAHDAVYEAYQGALGHGGMVLHSAAGNWARYCARSGDWEQAAVAGRRAVTAVEDLIRRQTHIDYKQAILRQASDLAGLTAKALRMTGRLPQAVEALERGQAMILVDQYARPSLIEERLRRSGHADLAQEYRLLASRRRSLDARDEELRQADERYRKLVQDRLSAIAEIRPLLAAPDPIGSLAGTPTVYLAPEFALVLDPAGALTAVDLPGLTSRALWRRAARFTNRVVAPANPPELRMDTIRETCRWLDQVAMLPLRPHLRGMEPVTLIPTGMLAGLPWHACESALDRAHTYLPTAAMAAPAATPLDAEAAAAAIIDPDHHGSRRLPGTCAEVEAMRQFFTRTRVLRGAEATGQRVEAALAGVQLAHFGCHGVSEPRQVLEGALLLAGSDRLRLRDLLAAPSLLAHARLVVLSACQTSMIDRWAPGESLNLTTGVLAAGAQAAIGSLWPVPDRATSALMTHFYASLSTGMTAPGALHHAQRELRADPTWRDRYYWAGFVYVGR